MNKAALPEVIFTKPEIRASARSVVIVRIQKERKRGDDLG